MTCWNWSKWDRMCDKAHQSTTIHHMQQRPVSYVAREQKWGLSSSGIWTLDFNTSPIATYFLLTWNCFGQTLYPIFCLLLTKACPAVRRKIRGREEIQLYAISRAQEHYVCIQILNILLYFTKNQNFHIFQIITKNDLILNTTPENRL